MRTAPLKTTQLARDTRIELDNLTLAALEWGEASATPILALHGWLDNAATYTGLAPLLTGHRITALDLAGHGWSDHRPPGVHYHLLDYVADVVNAIHALKLERLILMGHSLGAGIASIVAGTMPETIERLVLLEGIGPFAAPPRNAPAQLAQAIAELRRVEAKPPPRYPDLASACRARHAVSDMSYESAATLSERGARNDGNDFVWRADKRVRIRSHAYLTEPQVKAWLRAIDAPVFLLRASRGIPERYPRLQKRFGYVRRLQIHDIDGGHHVHLDDPAPVAKALRAFLAQADR